MKRLEPSQRTSTDNSIQARYKRLIAAYDDLHKRKEASDVELARLQIAVSKFIGIAAAVDVLKTTPKLTDAYLELCSAFKDSHE